MNKKIRQQVFETNSSSSHSISIAMADPNTVLDTMTPDEDGLIVLVGGEWGWKRDTHHDAWTKANYCARDISWQGSGKEILEWPSIEKRDMLIKVIKDQTGCTNVIFDALRINDGYIDHQSSGTTDEAFASHETLRQFIFNHNSYLETDNDNH